MTDEAIGYHLELSNTDLDDFVEHFEREFKTLAHWFLENEMTLPVYWMDKSKRLHDMSEYKNNYVLVIPNHDGRTHRSFYILWQKPDVEGYETGFNLVAQRFQRDRITLSFFDNPLSPHFSRFIEWLRSHWGAAVGDAARATEEEIHLAQSTMLPNTPPSVVDGYSRADIFDWWYRGGKLYTPELRDLASCLGIAATSIYNVHEVYKDSYGSKPMPENQSQWSGMTLPPFKGE